MDLVLRLTKENPTWAYDRIQDVLAKIGHAVLGTSVGNIPKANGIEPAPGSKQRTTWKTFVRVHWDVLAAIDFTTIEVWTKGGLETYYLLFVLDFKNRCIHFSGHTTNPNEIWIKPIARNIRQFDGLLNGCQYLLMDQDTKFGNSFGEILGTENIACLKLFEIAKSEWTHGEVYTVDQGRIMRSVDSVRRGFVL